MSNQDLPISCVVTLDAYQVEASKTAIFPSHLKTLYPCMGILGEAGEMGAAILSVIDRAATEDQEFMTPSMVEIREAISSAVQACARVEQLKKKARKNQIEVPLFPDLTKDEVDRVRSEGGDGLWYAACMAERSGMRLSEVAQANVAKLRERKAHGVIAASGETVADRRASSNG